MFCPQFRPLVGGAERQAEKLAEALVRIGCRVVILTPRIDPNSPDSEEINGVIIDRFPLNDLARRYPLSGIALLNIPYILWQIFNAVKPRLHESDILHCHSASLQTVGAGIAGFLADVPVLCKAATGDKRSDLGKIEETGVSGLLVAWLARFVIGTWVATTSAVGDALICAGVKPDKIMNIPNGAKLSINPNVQAKVGGVKHFLYLGRLSKNSQRDIPTVISAFDRLAAAHKDIELAIVGGGDLYDITRCQIDACQARERIFLPGFDKPEPWLFWADCFVLPSRREGLSNALLEAMAAGLPCIANDILPNREVLADGKAGVLVPVGDEDRLFEAMLSMVDDADHALAMRVAALIRVESHYSIEAVAASYMSLYTELIRKPSNDPQNS